MNIWRPSCASNQFERAFYYVLYHSQNNLFALLENHTTTLKLEKGLKTVEVIFELQQFHWHFCLCLCGNQRHAAHQRGEEAEVGGEVGGGEGEREEKGGYPVEKGGDI